MSIQHRPHALPTPQKTHTPDSTTPRSTTEAQSQQMEQHPGVDSDSDDENKGGLVKKLI